MSFKNQLFGLIKRNFLLKKREKFQTLQVDLFYFIYYTFLSNFFSFQEILFPLLIILPVLLTVTLGVVPDIKAKNQNGPISSPKNFPYTDNRNRVLYIVPNNTNTHEIARSLSQIASLRIKKTIFCQDRREMQRVFLNATTEKEQYRSRIDNYGIEFNDANTMTDYTIYQEWNENLFERYLFNSKYEMALFKNYIYEMSVWAFKIPLRFFIIDIELV